MRNSRHQTPVDDRDRICDFAKLSAQQEDWRALGLGRRTCDAQDGADSNETVNLKPWKYIVNGFVVAFIVLLLLGPMIINSLGFWAFVAGWVIIPVAFVTIAWMLMMGKTPEQTGNMLIELGLSFGHCGSCGSDLSDLPIEEDGCVVCPDCQAAWKADRIGTDSEQAL